MGMKVSYLCHHTYDIKISFITSGDSCAHWRQMSVISGPQVLCTRTDNISFSQFVQNMKQNVYHLRTTDVVYLY
jgi:hypothetical protein